MATTYNVTTSYTGKYAGEIISAAFKGADTLEQGLITIKENVKSDLVVKTLSTDDLVKDATCDFDPTTTVTVDERKLTVEKFQVNLQLCKDDFEADWLEDEMGSSAHNDRGLPQSFQVAMLEYILSKVAEKNDKNIWHGDEDNAGEFDGVLTLWNDSATKPAGQNIEGEPITPTNVAAEIGELVDAIPANVLDYGSDLQIVVSSNIARAYTRALAGFGSNGQGGSGYQNQGFVGEKPLNFDGIPMYIIGGLNSNTMVAYKTENIWFGTGVMSDWNEIKIKDMSEVDLSQNVRFSARFYAGVQYGIEDELTVYQDLTS